MPLIVEDGTGRPDAESYVTTEFLSDYAGKRAFDFGESDPRGIEPALIRATAYIDRAYRNRFPGYRTQQRAQALEWPRTGAYTYVPDNGRSDAYLPSGYGATAYDLGYSYIQANEIPREIKTAVCEAALRELAEPGSLSPDLERGGAVQSLSAGSVSITYGSGASAKTTFQAIDLALASLLMPSSAFSGKVVRG